MQDSEMKKQERECRIIKGRNQKENVGFRREETIKRMQDSERKKPQRKCRIQKGRNQKENVGFRNEETRKGMQDSEGKKPRKRMQDSEMQDSKGKKPRKRMQDSERKKPERKCRIQKGRNQKENVGFRKEETKKGMYICCCNVLGRLYTTVHVVRFCNFRTCLQ